MGSRFFNVSGVPSKATYLNLPSLDLKIHVMMYFPDLEIALTT